MDMMADKKALKDIVKKMAKMGGEAKPKGMAITVEKVGQIGKDQIPEMKDDKWPMVKEAIETAKQKVPEEFREALDEVEKAVQQAYYPYEKVEEEEAEYEG